MQDLHSFLYRNKSLYDKRGEGDELGAPRDPDRSHFRKHHVSTGYPGDHITQEGRYSSADRTHGYGKDNARADTYNSADQGRNGHCFSVLGGCKKTAFEEGKAVQKYSYEQ